ncbi:flagellar hook-length control protein FliK [Alteribacillus iranensis]|uniref:Hook-length control protein FliK n=1 Tax=Alteribacillus iranensis TaxID=930128 RepID=A0A1I2A574_9BACI|nr:flagellar hook-length control protein FliK [Alteribacillus iranensis]SFE38957.1 hook-length control protein FliK [Alteribacillus iranensis]
MEALFKGISLPIQHGSKSSNDTKQEEVGGNSTSKESTPFFQLLDRLIDSKEGSEPDAKNEKLPIELASLWEEGSLLVSHFSEEIRQTIGSEPFEWTGEWEELLQKLPAEYQLAAEQLEGVQPLQVLKDLIESVSGMTEYSPSLSTLPKFETNKTSFLIEKEKKPVQAMVNMFALLQVLNNKESGMEQTTQTTKIEDFTFQLNEVKQLVQQLIWKSNNQEKENIYKKSGSDQLQNMSVPFLLKSPKMIGENKRNMSTNDQLLQQIISRSVLSPVQEHQPLQTEAIMRESTGVLNTVEQAVIHLGDKKTDHAQQQQFIKQLQDLIGKSHLQSFRNGVQQLSIKLYPEHLGRLDVKLIQQNGSIHAHIMTTTKAAKEIVESQIHHLRQTFQLQNIPVERINIEEQVSYTQQEQNKEESREHKEQENHEQKKKETEEKETFSNILDDITFNEQA